MRCQVPPALGKALSVCHGDPRQPYHLALANRVLLALDSTLHVESREGSLERQPAVLALRFVSSHCGLLYRVSSGRYKGKFIKLTVITLRDTVLGSLLLD